MRIWYKQKEKSLTQDQNAMARRIADSLIKAQKKVADYLNRKTEGISAVGWLILLICFSVAFGSYCLYLIYLCF